MKRFVGVFVTAMLLLSGCASNVAFDYDQNVNFSKLKTYSLFTAKEPRAGHVKLDNPMIAERINRALEQQLSADGYQQVSSNPDFLVTYHLQVKQEIESRDTGFSTSFGVGRGSYGRYGGMGMAYGGPSYEVYSYDKGIMTIDILAASDKKLIWRGSTSRRLSSTSTPEKSKKAINEVVADIFSHYPPGKEK